MVLFMFLCLLNTTNFVELSQCFETWDDSDQFAAPFTNFGNDSSARRINLHFVDIVGMETGYWPLCRI